MTTSTSKGIRRVINSDTLTGATQLSNIADDVDALIGQTQSTIAGLPSTGNWVGRIKYVQEDESMRVWTGGAWIILFTVHNRKLDATNTLIRSRKQTGFGKIIGDGTSDIAEAVTFPTAFASIPVVIITYNGYRATGAFNTSGLTTSPSSLCASAQSISTTGFTAGLINPDGGALGNVWDWYYSWFAIGTR